MSAPEPDLTQTMASRRFAALLVLTSAVGVVAAYLTTLALSATRADHPDGVMAPPARESTVAA
jgi:hypothetical protein